jgi:hypothetical protein
MDKNFYKKIKNFKSFLLDNFNIIDNDIIKRNRKIDFKHIIYTCFNKFINHTSYDIEIGELNKHILDLPKQITKQGFNQRKNKINNDLFLQLNNNILNNIYKDIDKKKRHILVDGSHLHSNKSLHKYGFKYGSKRNTYTKSMISGIKDYDNNIPLNYKINKNMDERKSFIEQLEYIECTDILIFDRGYPSTELLKVLNNNNFNYIMRYKKDNLYVKILIKSSLNEYYFDFNGKKNKVVRYIINEKSYYLLTNLIDMSIDELKENYKKRWNIESHFRDLKHKTSIGNITSKTENSLLQELYINNLIYILTSYFKKLFINEILLKKNNNNKYKLNNSFIINTFFKDILKILLFKDLNKEEINNIFKYIYVALNIKYYFKDEIRHYERSLKGPINKWKGYIIK